MAGLEQCLSNVSMHSSAGMASRGGGVSCENADPDPVGLVWGLRLCIFNMLWVDTMLVHGLLEV